VSQPDMVNHPPHYNAHPSGVECITIVEHLPFNIGSAIKYLWRCGLKGDEIEDLRKAAWYVNREIERRQNIAATQNVLGGGATHERIGENECGSVTS
jgi:hypothetical protein